jgi:hypothetical protein
LHFQFITIFYTVIKLIDDYNLKHDELILVLEKFNDGVKYCDELKMQYSLTNIDNLNNIINLKDNEIKVKNIKIIKLNEKIKECDDIVIDIKYENENIKKQILETEKLNAIEKSKDDIKPFYDSIIESNNKYTNEQSILINKLQEENKNNCSVHENNKYLDDINHK